MVLATEYLANYYDCSLDELPSALTTIFHTTDYTYNPLCGVCCFHVLDFRRENGLLPYKYPKSLRLSNKSQLVTAAPLQRSSSPAPLSSSSSLYFNYYSRYELECEEVLWVKGTQLYFLIDESTGLQFQPLPVLECYRFRRSVVHYW